MAYTKKTWECGETITADALNRMEDGIEEALQSGGGTAGYSCTETTTLLTEETVTTAVNPKYPNYPAIGELSYVFAEEPPETLHITFDGAEYDCNRAKNPLGAYDYGASDPSFSDYPFIFSVSKGTAILATPTEGTYSIKLETLNTTVETSDCFQKAVESISPPPLVVNASRNPASATAVNPSMLDASLDAIREASVKRGVVVVDPDGNIYSITKIEWASGAVTVGEYQYKALNGTLKYPSISPT